MVQPGIDLGLVYFSKIRIPALEFRCLLYCHGGPEPFLYGHTMPYMAHIVKGTGASSHALMVKLTPGSPSKFLMADFVRILAQKVIAEICPVQPFVRLITHSTTLSMVTP